MEVNYEPSSTELSHVIPTVKEMLSVTETNGVTRVKINSSSLALIQECMRKSLYSLKEKWTSAEEPSATVYGSAIHRALEIFYKGNPSERKLPSLEQLELMSFGNRLENEESDLLLRAFRGFLEKASALTILPAEDKHSLQSGAYLLWNYFKSYIDDPYVAYVDDRGPFVEREFTFRLFSAPSLEIDYFGTIDLVVQNIHTGAILVADHKTTSIVGNAFYNRLKPNHQYTGYLLGARTIFGLKTNEFFVNALQKKAKPVKPATPGPHFPRQITSRDESDYEEFRDTVVTAVVSYLAALKSGVWPLGHVAVCASYGGCRYLSVCSAPKSMRKNILDAKYKKGVASEA